MKKELPKYLYHYCSFDNFLKILEGRSLLFTDITKSNDFREVNYALNCFKKYAKDEYNSDYLCNEIDRDFKEIIEKTIFLVACFSENKDNIRMFNDYAYDGVCLGFDSSGIQDWIKEIGVLNKSVVIYENMSQSKAFLDSVNYISEERLFSKFKAEYTEPTLKYKYLDDLYDSTCLFKSKDWENECEWRIHIKINMENSFERLYHIIPENIRCPKQLKMRIDSTSHHADRIGCLIPFDPQIISSITLSPNCICKKSYIQSILQIVGLDFLRDKLERSMYSD